MPAKRDRNLRKGHLAEDIGISVLRGFSAVSQARHQDDIGVDAFAVLLRPEGRTLYAGATVGFQFKAQSVSVVEYDSEETIWFENLDIPFFFAKVDSSAGEVSFYTPVRRNLFWSLNENYSRLKFVFESETAEVEDGVGVVGMAPPILECTELESRTDEFADRAYQLFSSWAEYIARNKELKKFRINRVPRWTSGSTPVENFRGSETRMDELEAHLALAQPAIDKLSFHALRYSPPNIKLLKSFLQLHEWYKSAGFEEGCLVSPEIIESQLAQFDNNT